jgi:hypothetical protein
MKPTVYFVITLLLLFYFVCIKTNAQSPEWLWAKSIGGNSSDGARSMVVDPESGDVYATGSFSGTVDFDPGEGTFDLISAGTSNIFITKIDGSGNFVWAKAMGSPDVAYVLSIAFDPAGNRNIYTTGSFQGTVDFDPGPDTFNLTSSGISDIFITKLDYSGNFVWARAVGGPDAVYVLSIALDPSGSGDVYITGYFRGTVDFDPGPESFDLTSLGSDDIFISKLDSYGNFVWAKSLGGSGSDVGRCITIDPTGNGDICTTGWFSGKVDFDPGPNTYNLTAVGRFDIFISKIDGSGHFVWAKQLGGAGIKDGAGFSIAIDPKSGDIYTTGYFEGTADFDPDKGIFTLVSSGLRDIFISKLDRMGNFLWAKAMGGTGLDAGGSIAIDPVGSGDVYTTGYFLGTVDFDSGPGSFNLTSVGPDDIFISKLDDMGNFEWAKSIHGTKEEAANTIALDDLGNVYVAGFFNGPTISFDSKILSNAAPTKSTADIFIAKLDPIATSVVNIHSQPHQIEIYPNPTKDLLRIKVDKEVLDNIKITLFSQSGEVVFSSADNNISHDIILDISRFPSAIYLVEVIANENKIAKQIVKILE